MKITVFTSNQPRHLSLINTLASVADQVYAVQECNTVTPGQVEDFFRKSAVMQKYFARVVAAEAEVFGRLRFSPSNVSHLSIKMGDLNRLEMNTLEPALASDVYVVFGASYIKGPLCEHLVSKRAYNIHMGVSPMYRGSSTNFWALYDGHPEYVGATIHLLTAGLDSGPMLFHALPRPERVDGFLLGMKSVKVAHEGLRDALVRGDLQRFEPEPQDKGLELRYTRNKDFTDEVAEEYLAREPSPQDIARALESRDPKKFLRLYSPE